MSDYFFYADKMTVGYQGKPLIRDIKIELNRGEILTLIGPNGAGKSTILKSITRQLQLIGGKVWLDQKELTRMSGKEVAKKQAVVLTERIQPELMTHGRYDLRIRSCPLSLKHHLNRILRRNIHQPIRQNRHTKQNRNQRNQSSKHILQYDMLVEILPHPAHIPHLPPFVCGTREPVVRSFVFPFIIHSRLYPLLRPSVHRP